MTPLPDVLPIRPFTQPARGEVTLPGSKSITNRALLLAALCDGPVTLTGALFSEDTEIMAEALRRLGFMVKEDPVNKEIYVEGRGGEIPAQQADLFVGNAGTAARFLTALCAAAKRGVFRLDGVPQMRKRPMKGLLEALEKQGAVISYEGESHCFPFVIEAHGLRGGEVEIDASESSQMMSALLMVAPLAKQSTRVWFNLKLRWPFVGMTCELMKIFGIAVRTVPANPVQALDVPIEIYDLHADTYSIEPDATAASYFAALPLATRGKQTLLNLKHGLQGDTQFLDVLKRTGLTGISDSPKGLVVESGLSYTGIGVRENFNEFSDTFLTLAAITPLLRGPTQISGIAHSRRQETDRVAGMANELRRLGQGVVEEHDSLTITPDLAELKRRAAAAVAAGGQLEIETYKDHRFAMSFAIFGCHDLLGDGRPWLAIKNPACCAKTFPNFFDVLGEVWNTSHAV